MIEFVRDAPVETILVAVTLGYAAVFIMTLRWMTRRDSLPDGTAERWRDALRAISARREIRRPAAAE